MNYCLYAFSYTFLAHCKCGQIQFLKDVSLIIGLCPPHIVWCSQALHAESRLVLCSTGGGYIGRLRRKDLTSGRHKQVDITLIRRVLKHSYRLGFEPRIAVLAQLMDLPTAIIEDESASKLPRLRRLQISGLTPICRHLRPRRLV